MHVDARMQQLNDKIKLKNKENKWEKRKQEINKI